MPFFSVVIPVYNIENYIRNCLDSVANQIFEDYEVLLIDDGTKDGSGAICDEYAKRYPTRFFSYHFENGGVSAARNRGLVRAQGKYVVFVDGDDILDRSYLQTFYDMICGHEAIDLAICGILVNGKNIVFGGSQSNNGLLTQTELINALPERKGIRGFLFNKAFRRSILAENHIRFDESAHMCEDLLFCVEFARHLRAAYFINKPNYDYVQRADSAVNLRFNPKRISVLTTYEKVLAILGNLGVDGAIERARVNYLMHHVHVLWMLRGKDAYPEVKNTAKRFIKENIGIIWSAKLEARGKCKAIAMYLLSPML